MPLHILKTSLPRWWSPTHALSRLSNLKISRRSMLRFSAAAVGTGLLPTLPGCTAAPSFPTFQGRPGPRPDRAERWALLSDLHLCGNTGVSWGSVNMADHARAAVAGVLNDGQPLAGVLVNGDCALEFGGAGDYQVFRDVVAAPVAAARIPLHLTLGNHDHRGRFCAALRRPVGNPADGIEPSHPADVGCDRCASVVRGRYANFFLLDSLDDQHHLAGSIGRRQLAWLDAALADLNDRPAVVFGHHPIDSERDWLWGNISLLDGPDLWAVLDAHPHVKAYVYGHTHRWGVERRGHVHLVNLPSTAYVFDPGQPSGWVDLWLGPDGALLQLHRLKPAGVERPGEAAAIEWA